MNFEDKEFNDLLKTTGANFNWGVSSSALQTEGSHDSEGKGLSIWDVFSKQKKKINVLEWLNTNPKPEISFDKFHESIQITKEDVDFLFHNSCTDTIQEILRREIYEKYEFPIFPVFACNAKTYIYHDIWQECARDIMIRFLDKVHIKLIQQVSTWKKEYLDANKDDNEGTELYNKATVKLMNMDFKKESVFSKIKAVMYTRIKMDI
jgi:hypothetical protein